MTLRRIRPSIPPQQIDERSKTKIGGNMAHKQTTDGEAHRHRPPPPVFVIVLDRPLAPFFKPTTYPVNHPTNGPVQLRPAPGGAGAFPSVAVLLFGSKAFSRLGWRDGETAGTKLEGKEGNKMRCTDREGRQQIKCDWLRFLPPSWQRIEHLYMYLYICPCRAFRLVVRLPTSSTN